MAPVFRVPQLAFSLVWLFAGFPSSQDGQNRNPGRCLPICGLFTSATASDSLWLASEAHLAGLRLASAVDQCPSTASALSSGVCPFQLYAAAQCHRLFSFFYYCPLLDRYTLPSASPDQTDAPADAASITSIRLLHTSHLLFLCHPRPGVPFRRSVPCPCVHGAAGNRRLSVSSVSWSVTSSSVAHHCPIAVDPLKLPPPREPGLSFVSPPVHQWTCLCGSLPASPCPPRPLLAAPNFFCRSAF